MSAEEAKTEAKYDDTPKHLLESFFESLMHWNSLSSYYSQIGTLREAYEKDGKSVFHNAPFRIESFRDIFLGSSRNYLRYLREESRPFSPLFAIMESSLSRAGCFLDLNLDRLITTPQELLEFNKNMKFQLRSMENKCSFLFVLMFVAPGLLAKFIDENSEVQENLIHVFHALYKEYTDEGFSGFREFIFDGLANFIYKVSEPLKDKLLAFEEKDLCGNYRCFFAMVSVGRSFQLSTEESAKAQVKYLDEQYSSLKVELNLGSDFKRAMATAFVKQLEKLSHEQQSALFVELGKSPHVAKRYYSLYHMEVKDRGNDESSWTKFLVEYFKKLEVPRFEVKEEQKRAEVVSSSTFSIQKYMEEHYPGYVFKKVFGRSILFEDSRSGKAVVIKLQKDGETFAELEREYQMDKICNKSLLKSDTPKPLKLGETSKFWQSELIGMGVSDDGFAMLETMIKPEFDKSPGVLIYEAPKSYTNYITDVTDFNVFKESMFNSASDLVMLFKAKGYIFPQLIPLTHNDSTEREDKGRYQVLTHILRSVFGRTGVGRLHAFDKATSYANIRESGIADLGDSIHLSEVFDWDNPSSFVNTYFKEAIEVHGGSREKASLAVLSELISEYFLTFSLLINRWGLNHEPTCEVKKKSHWEKLSKFTLEVYAQLYSGFTGENYSEVLENLKAFSKVERHAAQARYWVASEYGDDIRKRKLPEGLYSNKADIKIGAAGDFRNSGNLSERGAYFETTPGDGRDLGPTNGVNPMKEDERIRFYLMNSLIPKVVTNMKSESPTLLGEATGVFAGVMAVAGGQPPRAEVAEPLCGAGAGIDS